MSRLDNLQNFLSRAVNPGDDILVHSSLKSLGFVARGADQVLDLLLNAVGPMGTLVMMTATTGFAQSKHFDVLRTKSETGLLTEVMRLRYPDNRSFVPMTSFVASGVRASQYTSRFNSYLDESSPFTSLLRNRGKVLLLGVNFDRCTLYHLPEERFKVPYNDYKTFSGWGVNGLSKTLPVEQRYYVRKSLSIVKDPISVSANFATSSLCCVGNLFPVDIYSFGAEEYVGYMSEKLIANRLCLIQ